MKIIPPPKRPTKGQLIAKSPLSNAALSEIAVSSRELFALSAGEFKKSSAALLTQLEQSANSLRVSSPFGSAKVETLITLVGSLKVLLQHSSAQTPALEQKLDVLLVTCSALMTRLEASEMARTETNSLYAALEKSHQQEKERGLRLEARIAELERDCNTQTRAYNTMSDRFRSLASVLRRLDDSER